MAWRGYYGGDWHYTPAVPLKAKGGIKAQSRKGDFAKNWWAKRWIDVLESFNMGARLTRGRSYARKGQVVSVNVERGKVRAAVQGTRPKPYDVVIAVKELAEKDWKKVAKALSGGALYAAKLLAGEMPPDIEDVFNEVGVSLFPRKRVDLKTECSCPDWSNPCKHIAAVYYLLGEEFDRDPFLIFKLRGITREEIIDLIGADSPESVREKAKSARKEAGETACHAAPGQIALDPACFWNAGPIPSGMFDGLQIPPASAALPKRLGAFPFWRGSERFLDILEPIYANASRRGMNVFAGEPLNSANGSEKKPQKAIVS